MDRLEVITATYGGSRSTQQRRTRPFLSASIEFIANTASYRLRPLEYHSRQPALSRFDPFAARRVRPVGIDVNWTLRIAGVDVAVGLIAPVRFGGR